MTEHPGLVVLEGVNKHFGSLHVLKDINLNVDRGQVIVVEAACIAGQVRSQHLSTRA